MTVKHFVCFAYCFLFTQLFFKKYIYILKRHYCPAFLFRLDPLMPNHYAYSAFSLMSHNTVCKPAQSVTRIHQDMLSCYANSLVR